MYIPHTCILKMFHLYGFYPSVNWQLKLCLNSDLHQSHLYHGYVFQCYCLGSDILLTRPTQTKCTNECNHPIVACGYDHKIMKHAYLSIYKINHRGKFLRHIKGITKYFFMSPRCIIVMFSHIIYRLVWSS
jgi:hypothetical protein